MSVPHGVGPVVFSPTVYTSFWGPSWKTSNAALSQQLIQFTHDLMACEPWMNILTQYGVSGTGLFGQASFLEFVPNTLTVSSYRAIFQSSINAGLIPEPEDVNHSKTVGIVIVFLDQHVIIDGEGRQLNFPGANFAGYHDWFTTSAGNPFIYAFCEFNNINSTCNIMSHEFAEMITDPLYNAWTPDGGDHEIGDCCDPSETEITVGGRTWTVQKIWSNVANACVGSAPKKIPPIRPGPGDMTIPAPALGDLGRKSVRAALVSARPEPQPIVPLKKQGVARKTSPRDGRRGD